MRAWSSCGANQLAPGRDANLVTGSVIRQTLCRLCVARVIAGTMNLHRRYRTR